MSFYYVKNGGTATGDAGRYASQQSGSFAALGASGYYNDISDAINATTSPIAADFINFSDLHVISGTDNPAYVGLDGSTYYIVCVDDANIDAARTSGNRGSEQNTGQTDITFTNAFASGLHVISADNITFVGSNVVYDCELEVTGGNDIAVSPSGDGANVKLIGVTINCSSVGTTNLRPMTCSGGGTINMVGGAVITASAGLQTLTHESFVNGGGAITLKGVDLTAVTGTLIANVGSSNLNDDTIDVRMDMCKIASGVAFTNETFKSHSNRALFTRCSDSSASAEHQYHLHAFGGDVDDDSTIRRAEDPAFEDSGVTISYKIVTNSDASIGSPLWFDFPNPRWAALSSAGADTLRLHIASTATLTDVDFRVELIYPDGTNRQTPNFFSTGPSTVGGVTDLMAAGTELTTDSGSDWRDGASALTGHNEYILDIDTSGDVGADTVPVVRVYITKASTTIQLASIYALV